MASHFAPLGDPKLCRHACFYRLGCAKALNCMDDRFLPEAKSGAINSELPVMARSRNFKLAQQLREGAQERRSPRDVARQRARLPRRHALGAQLAQGLASSAL